MDQSSKPNVKPQAIAYHGEIETEQESRPAKINTDRLSIFYGKFRAVTDFTLAFPLNRITAIIGPSGCGKSTVLRSLNRMNDLIPGTHIEGVISLDAVDVYSPDMDVVDLRRRVGMVFQRPNPFPMSVFDNIAFGPRLYGRRARAELNATVEHSLTQAALWDEVKDKLNEPALSLSGGQQQRLCIARALAVEPEVILMDEPASALDPSSTLRIEDLMQSLKMSYTIVIVTHNMQQAARASDFTAFMMIDDQRSGRLVEFDRTQNIFTRPKNKQTEDYITGRFG